MKIVHQGPVSLPILHDRGGATERRMVEIAAAQVAAGHDVRILSAESAASITEHRGIKVQGVRIHTQGSMRDYEMLLAARRYLSADHPDILHFHAAHEGARFNTHLNIPTVLSVDYFRYRGTGSSLVRRYYKRSLGRFERILPVSESCAVEFRQFWGTPAPIEILYNGVNADQFRPDPESGQRIRSELGLEGVILLYVGRLCDQKGTEILLDAWERIRSTGMTLVLAGPIGQFGIAQSSELPERMKRLGVYYLGAVAESRLADIYNACDVFVMPTLHDEMFGMAALEAQACGKPVVASRLGGLLEAVGDKSGLFVTPGDRGALIEALTELAGDASRRIGMGAAAREHALDFTWARIAERLQSIYEAIM